MKMQRFSRRRFLFILCFGLILIMALLWMVLSINKRRYVHIGQLLDVTEELPLSTANNLNPDDSISIRVTSLEWHPEQQNGCKVSYEIRNDAGRQFLIVLSGGIIECSSDGKAWYPFANERMAYLQDDSRMLYAMGWMISFAFGRYEPFYLPPGTSFNSFYFHLDEDLMESASQLEMIPDGYYRIVFRFCEYLDIEMLSNYEKETELVDYGYYAGYFRIKNGKIYSG